MDPTYRFVLHIGWGLVIFGSAVLAVMALIFRLLKKKEEFGVEADLGRAARVCIHAGLIVLGIVALGATIQAVGLALRHH